MKGKPMKNLSRLLAPLAGMLLITAQIVVAQTQGQSLDDIIKQAKDEVGKLEAFIQSASPSLGASLQPVLESRKAAIKDLEALSKMPVKLSQKELGDTLKRLTNNSTGESTSATPVAIASELGIIDKIHEGDVEVRGKGALPDMQVQIVRNGVSIPSTVTANHNGDFVWNPPPNQPLNDGELISFKQKIGENRFSPESDFFKVESVDQKVDTRLASPIGYLLGGIVLSQQAQEFKQSDPFFGFVGGYNFGAFPTGRDAENRMLDKEGYVLECPPDNPNCNECPPSKPPNCDKCPPSKPPDCNRKEMVRKMVRKMDRAGRYIKGQTEYRRAPGQLRLQFQGIFQTAPRAVEGTTTNSTGATNPVDFTPFIASRKTFDTEVRLSNQWLVTEKGMSLGIYGLWGGSTILSKTELEGESGVVQSVSSDNSTTPKACSFVSNSTSGGGTAANNTVCQLRIDNDIKQYKEGGLIMDISLLNKKLYLQSLLGYGNYEALKGLDLTGKHQTQNRFVGRLRIFPTGLNRDFSAQRTFAPMFGVEVNAGYGPDQIKFFFGSIIRIKGLTP